MAQARGRRHGKSFDAIGFKEAAAENAVATFACGIMLNVKGLQERLGNVIAGPASIRVLFSAIENPNENGVEKGQRELTAKQASPANC